MSCCLKMRGGFFSVDSWGMGCRVNLIIKNPCLLIIYIYSGMKSVLLLFYRIVEVCRRIQSVWVDSWVGKFRKNAGKFSCYRIKFVQV